MKSLYYALVNGYADYSKVYLIDEEIDFFIDESSSVFMSDITYPLNSNTLYKTYELWIVGNYSETEKTTVYRKDNLKISPKAQRFYIKNIEFIGKYGLKKIAAKRHAFIALMFLP